MLKRIALVSILGLLIACPGCGKSDSATVGGTSTPAPSNVAAPVKQVASEFLEALRTGNSDAAAAKLTAVAQQRMREAEMDFSLLANSAATYQIGNVELFEANEASVETIWTEPDAAGNSIREQWTIALQRYGQEWRILGIIADSGAGQQPLVMDFENPEQPGTAQATAATTNPPASGGVQVPQQATLPTAQDPFRQ